MSVCKNKVGGICAVFDILCMAATGKGFPVHIPHIVYMYFDSEENSHVHVFFKY